jgi:hypothetical protein
VTRRHFRDARDRSLDRLPTAKEINLFDSLDERDAEKHFLGKSLDQAESLFRENFSVYQEDLMFMGPVAFRFYVPAAIRFLLSPESDFHSDAAYAFCDLIEYRLDHEPDSILSVAEDLRQGSWPSSRILTATNAMSRSTETSPRAIAC